MKKTFSALCGAIFLLLGSQSINAQSTVTTDRDDGAQKETPDENEPIMFKFEPDYVSSITKRREEIARTKEILDTLNISESKRRKLLRDLYKSGESKRLSKVLLADTVFEEFEN